MTIPPKNGTRPKECAKSRRQNENRELTDLAQLLPLPDSVAPQLDKASVIRLTSSYLKLRKLFPGGLGREWGDSGTAFDNLLELGKFLNKALHGFVFVLGPDATILYISEEASAQLGYSQVQITGKSFWEFIHTYDAEEVKAILCFEVDIPAVNVGNTVLEDVEVPRSFAVRMKCILPKRQAELAIDGYKVIHCRGYLKLKRKPPTSWDGPSNVFYEVTGIVATGHSLSPTPSAELKLYRRDFMFRTGLSLKFVYIEPGSQKITGYEPMQLKDKSLYKFVHPFDCKQMQEVHILTVKKTQAISSYYRFLTKYGGWIWIQSSCVVIANNKADRDHCILFVNNVLSEREYSERLLDMEQAQSSNNGQSNPSKKLRASNKTGKKISHSAQRPSPPTNPKLANNLLHKSGSSEILIPSTQLPIRTDIVHNNPFSDTYGFVQQDLQSSLTEPQKISNNYYSNANGLYNVQLPSAYNISNSYSVQDAQTELCNLGPIVNAITCGEGGYETLKDMSEVTEFGVSKEGNQMACREYPGVMPILKSSHTPFSYDCSIPENKQVSYNKPYYGDFTNAENNDSNYSSTTLTKEKTDELSDSNLSISNSVVDSAYSPALVNELMDFQSGKFKASLQLLQLNETLNYDSSNNIDVDCQNISDSCPPDPFVELKSDELRERNTICDLSSNGVKNNILLTSSNQYHLNGVHVFTPYSSTETHFNNFVNINTSNIAPEKAYSVLTQPKDMPANELQFTNSVFHIDMTASDMEVKSSYNLTKENGSFTISSQTALDQNIINCKYHQNNFDISHSNTCKDSSVVANNSAEAIDMLFSSPIDKACQIISSTPINQALIANHRENDNLESSRSLFHTVLDIERITEITATEQRVTANDNANLSYKSQVVEDFALSNSLQISTDGSFTRCQVPSKDYQPYHDYPWNRTHSESVPKSRSDSVSSTSMGYMSGSSNMDQSSPRSAFSESACLSNQSDENLMLGSSDVISRNYNA